MNSSVQSFGILSFLHQYNSDTIASSCCVKLRKRSENPHFEFYRNGLKTS